MSKLSFSLPLALLLSSALPLAAQAPDPVLPDVTIAFLGDQGLGGDAEAVLQLIRDEGADAVIHMGDFDYADDPAAWDAQIDAFLGPDFPYFASVGNHDQGKFYGPGGYQELLEARMNRLGIPWEGDLGVRSSFHFDEILVVLTAPGSFGDGDEVYAPYIREALAADDSVWSISAWHKNMRRMQVGGKSDETGWGVYEESRRGGAIVATAHEHSYSRTHLMTDFQNQEVASTQPPLVLAADDPGTPEDEGRSFAFVSGLGGHSIRDQEIDGPWWASVYTSDQGARSGALFGVFNYEGDPALARFYFKDVGGRIVDDFFVMSSLGPTAPTLRIADVAVSEGDSGTREALLRVTLRGTDGQAVAVDYATADGSAVAGEDYETTAGRLAFSGAVTEQTLSVPIRGDESLEGDESLFVELLAADGAIVARRRGEIVILDDDAPPSPLHLEVVTLGSGGVTLDPPGGLYPSGTEVRLTAVAAPGHAFAGWDGDLAGAANPATLVVARDHQVTALFTALDPALLQLESGAATNTVSVSTHGLLTPAVGDLYLAAIASKPNAVVTSVSGLGLAWSPVRTQCAGRGQTGLAVWQARGEPTAASVVTATFSEAPESSVLAVSRYGGLGAVDPARAVSANSLGVAGACAGGSDGARYAFGLDTATFGSLVYVAAAARNQDHLPGLGFVERAELFSGSGGSIAGVSVADAPTGAPAPVAIEGAFAADVDWAVVALELPVAAPFRLVVEPSPGGGVRIDPPSGAYVPGAPVTLTAVPEDGHRFVGWSGDAAGAESPVTLVMDADKSVGATFVRQFRVNLGAASGGSITLDPPGGLYDAGSSVTVTAAPALDHRFTGWAGALTGLDNPASLVVDGDAFVAAGFVRVFDVNVAPGPGGSVVIDPPVGPYEDGSTVLLMAIPDARHRFGDWSGVLAGAGNPALLVIEADEIIAASFVPQLTISGPPTFGGFVTLDPPGGVYDPGTSVTLTATADAGLTFGGWDGDLAGAPNPASVVVDRDLRIGARFLAPATPQQVESGTSGNAPSVATAGALAAVEGDLYVAAIAFKPHVAVSGVSGLGLAWSPIDLQCAGRGQTGLAIWQARGQPTGDGGVSASFSAAPQNAVLVVSRYASADVLDPAAAVSANSLGIDGACDGGVDADAYALELGTTTAGGLAYVATAMRNRDHLPGSGYEERIEMYQGSGGSVAGLSLAEHRVAAAGPTAVAGRFDSTVDWAAIALEIPASPVPAVGTGVPIPEPSQLLMLTSALALLVGMGRSRIRP